MVADFIVSASGIRRSGVLTVKQFGSCYKVIWCKSIRSKGYEKASTDDIDYMVKNTAPIDNSSEKLANNISRARSKIFEYAFCNQWDYFITLTIDSRKYDRYSLDDYVKHLGKFINNYNTNHHSKILYLLIPERHKDGAWHIHGLISGILEKHLIINKNGYLDFSLYSKKFGYCSLSPVKYHDRVSRYITKYVTKELATMPFGQRLYYCSKGLATAKVLYQFDNIDSTLLKWDFEHPDGYCKSVMVDNLDFLQNMTMCL